MIRQTETRLTSGYWQHRNHIRHGNCVGDSCRPIRYNFVDSWNNNMFNLKNFIQVTKILWVYWLPGQQPIVYCTCKPIVISLQQQTALFIVCYNNTHGILLHELQTFLVFSQYPTWVNIITLASKLIKSVIYSLFINNKGWLNKV